MRRIMVPSGSILASPICRFSAAANSTMMTGGCEIGITYRLRSSVASKQAGRGKTQISFMASRYKSGRSDQVSGGVDGHERTHNRTCQEYSDTLHLQRWSEVDPENWTGC